MDLDFFLQNAEASALVEKKKKAAHFKITPIEDIHAWRMQQSAKETLQQLRLEARDDRIAQFEAETGQKLDAPGLSKAGWSDRVAFAQAERKRLALLEETAEKYQPTPERERTYLGRVIDAFKRLWKAANF